MKNIRKYMWCFILTVMLAPALAQSATLANIDTSMSLGYASPPPSDVETRFIFDIGGFIFNLEFGGTVFDLLLSSDDAGKTFAVSSGTEFEEAVGFLTNGVNDWITFEFGEGGTGWTEGGYFFGNFDGTNGIDLAGSQIDSINLHVNNIGPAGGSGDLYLYNLNALVSIEGTPAIPEPATRMYLLTGLMLVALAMRRSLGRGAIYVEPVYRMVSNSVIPDGSNAQGNAELSFK